MLIISTVPYDHCSPADHSDGGKNRFECRTCPYQMVLDRKYYERKGMELKAAEDVLGGADSWKNVDKTESMSALTLCPHTAIFSITLSSFLLARQVCKRRGWRARTR